MQIEILFYSPEASLPLPVPLSEEGGDMLVTTCRGGGAGVLVTYLPPTLPGVSVRGLVVLSCPRADWSGVGVVVYFCNNCRYFSR